MADKWKQTALLVIDMQGRILTPVKGGKAILPNVIKAVEVARKRSILVVWVVREHDYFGRDRELFRWRNFTPGGPATVGTEGAELVDGLEMRKADYKLVKTRFSALFFDTNLHTFLHSNGIKNLMVTGRIQTPNCIRQTVFDAVSHDYSSVSVIVDASAAAAPEIHYANIFDMKNIGVATPTLEEWAAETNGLIHQIV